VLFFDQYKRSEIVLRALACIVLNWVAIIFFLFVLALAIHGVNTLMGLGL
jgi:succinate dehydrogenase/fumarate reductase cytochrome b subunit